MGRCLCFKCNRLGGWYFGCDRIATWGKSWSEGDFFERFVGQKLRFSFISEILPQGQKANEEFY